MMTLIVAISIVLMKTSFSDVNDLNPFECGFEEITIPRNRFSIKFYMVAIVFLVFDVEIAIILPLLVRGWSTPRSRVSCIALPLLWVLLLGLWAE